MNIPPIAGLIARLLVGAVLVYAGATKTAAPVEEFAIVIANYRILPPDASQTAAAFLPWVEMVLGWALILGFRKREAALGSLALFGAFLFALASVQMRGIELPTCGCFGEGIHFTPPQAFLFDALLVALCFAAWRAAPSSLSLDSWTEGGYTGTRKPK
jgi:uncharacterized membrane protein YphA (DoxX/SURF4 family)